VAFPLIGDTEPTVPTANLHLKTTALDSHHVVASQYWNQVHGFTPDDVRRDLEGLQTMRTLANNMAWLLKSIETGRKAGVPLPEKEEMIFTNFIR